MPPPTLLPARLASLDQYRGYTVLGMFLVNFVGSFAAVKQLAPLLCHHHTYLSYADTIMPQFFLAVGFAYRMTYLRRYERGGARAAYGHALKRIAGLLLVAFLVHRLDGRYESWAALTEQGPLAMMTSAFQRNFFQTLTHIALTSLWVLPVIGGGAIRRILFAVGSAGLFHAVSHYGYYDWVLALPGIDGGPLGFLTWTIPLLVGSLAYDAMVHHADPLTAREDGTPPNLLDAASKMIFWAVFLMLLGYGLSCLNRATPPNAFSAAEGWKALLVEPPFVPPSEPVNIWTMSQRAGSVSYLTFAAGLALGLYGLFVVACDVWPLSVGLFRTLGTNALAGYILHILVAQAMKPFVPGDSPLWYVAAALAVFLTICYTLVRYLEKHRLFLKL